VTRSEKTGKQKGCNFTIYWAYEPLGAKVTKVGLYHDVRTAEICSKLGVDRLTGFESADP
jgi:hypothetical protein